MTFALSARFTASAFFFATITAMPIPMLKTWIHFCARDLPVLRQDLENGRDTPALRVDHGVAIFGQNAREIVDQSAAGDVRETMQLPARDFRQQRLIVLVRAQQLFA